MGEIKTRKERWYYFEGPMGPQRYTSYYKFNKGSMSEDGWTFPHLYTRVPLFWLNLFFSIHFVWYGVRLTRKWFVLGIEPRKLTSKIQIITWAE